MQEKAEFIQMNSFDILDPQTSLRGALLLEASAGTGKTFAIEHCALRLLLDQEQPLEIDQLLLITFTKAAVRDLRLRLHQTLLTAQKALQGLTAPPPWSYLTPFFEVTAKRKAALRHLKRSLLAFETAPIYTIHSFCQRILSDDPLLSGSLFNDNQAPASSALLEQVVRDVLRSELNDQLFHPVQLKILLDSHQHNGEELVQELVKLLQLCAEPITPNPYKKAITDLEETLTFLRQTHTYTHRLLLEDFEKIVKSKKELTKIESMRQRAERFAALLDQSLPLEDPFTLLLHDGLVWSDLDRAPMRKGQTYDDLLQKLHYPALFDLIQKKLNPIIAEQRNPSNLLMRLLAPCHKLLLKRLESKGLFRYDDLLTRAFRSVDNSQQLKERLQAQYKAVIVDEFQDTDAVQWQLLQSLFNKEDWKGLLLLVGDPKQSIYSFRQADVYSYMEAAQFIGNQGHASLVTNWRSHPRLLEGLNTLFKAIPELICLPRWQTTLPYPSVIAGCHPEQMSLLPDHECSVQLVLRRQLASSTDELPWFNHMVDELYRMQREYAVQPANWAVLVRDRWQAERLANHLDSRGIPYKRQHSLEQEDAASRSLRELLIAIENPKSLAELKTALMGRILRSSPQEIAAIDSNLKSFEETIILFTYWRNIAKEKGVGALFHLLCHTPSVFIQSEIGKQLISEEGEFANSLWCLMSRLIGQLKDVDKAASLKAAINLLDRCSNRSESEEKEASLPSFTDKNALNIVTMHSSKGLEYDLVYVMGLLGKSSLKVRWGFDRLGVRRVIYPLETLEEMTLHEEELQAEMMRLFYVAATRARYRLYLPLSLSEQKSRSSSKGLSIAELFLNKLLSKPLEDSQELIEKINLLIDSKPVIEVNYDESVEEKKMQTTPPLYSDPGSGFLPLALQKRQKLLVPITPKYSLRSFTSQIKGLHSYTPFSFDSDCKEELWEGQEDHLFLPGGKETGILLHEIYEQLPFHLAYDKNKLKEVATPLIRQTMLVDWEEELLNLVYCSLMMPLEGIEKSIRLADLQPHQLLKEEEFLFQDDEQRLWRGIIDLIFLHEDRYYLLDWKSNRIKDDDYTKPALDHEMKKQGYFEQERIYRQALQRYLVALNSPSTFGGSFYFFIRGSIQQQGIFFIP